MMLSTLFFALAMAASRVDAASWGYDVDNGPDTWASDFGYADCAASAQSPIDFVSDEVQPGDFAASLEFSAGYDAALSGLVENNGHTVVFLADDGSGATVTGGPAGGETYEFVQVHFHWGADDTSGSEHTFDGDSFPLEMHFVHKNVKYADLGEAISNADGLLVIGVMFVKSDFLSPEQALLDFVDAVETVGGMDLGETVAHTLTLSDFMGGFASAPYLNYAGSLTTPPCSEAVTWVVLALPMIVESDQMEVFRALVDSNDDPLVDNYRPPQPTNGRTVKVGLPMP